MARQHGRGTRKQPIEFLDSDNDSNTLDGSSLIDLTEEDNAHQPILQQAGIKHGEFSSKPAFSPYFHSQHAQELILWQPSVVVNGESTPSTVQNETRSFHRGNSLPIKVLRARGNNGFTEQKKESASGTDVGIELSNIMETTVPQGIKRAYERTSRIADETDFNLPTSNGSASRSPYSEVADESMREVHSAPFSKYHTSSCPLLSVIEETLLSVRYQMEREHALCVDNQLQRALARSGELQAGVPDFSDVIDPFAQMLPIDGKDARTQNKDQVRTMNQENGDGDTEVSRTPQRLPRYKHYITITRSFLVPDNHKLYFEPYLGQNIDNDENTTDKWLAELRKLYDPPEDGQASRHREYVFRLQTYLPTILERLSLEKQDVLSYIIDTGQVLVQPPDTILSCLLVAFKTVFGTEIGEVFPEYDKHMEEVKGGTGKPDNPAEIDPIKNLLQPHLLSCPVCQVYLCGIHGVYETDDSEDEEKGACSKVEKGYADMNMTYKGMMNRHKERFTNSDPATDSVYKGKPCGLDCFSIKGIARRKQPRWATKERTYFEALFLGMQSEARAACILAPLMERPCYDVQNFVLSLSIDAVELTQTESRKSEKLDWYDNRRKKIRVDLDWGKKTNTHLHDKIPQATGCEHIGVSCFEARDECSCNAEGILCGKFCACPDDCYMKFTGCDCSKDGSPCSQDSLTCPCKLLNRECDPDLCHNCGAVEKVDPFLPTKDLLPHTCCNTEIQRGLRKRLLVGESSHPGNIGFGAYLAEPAKEGEFIAEYVGEIISYAECGRRSEIYDKLKMSFIFDLNDEVVIDSYRYGNMERFINHSKKHANCKPLVKLVNGEHRIGFYAMKDLNAGVELFFDYGKEFVLKQRLKEIETLPGKKRVGFRKAKRIFLGNNESTKDMESCSDEGNTTVGDDEDLPTVEYSFAGEDEANEYNEKELEDSRRPSRRPRRSVKIPKKYTR